MDIETIEAGQWIVTEGETPYFSIYKLVKGKVSIYKGSKKIREVEIKEGMRPIMPGITAVMSDDHKHTASVKAETDIEVEKVSVDHLLGIMRNEFPRSIRNDISIMTKSIVSGNEIISKLNEFSNLPSVELEIPDGIGPEALEILSEIKRLYELITADVASITQRA